MKEREFCISSRSDAISIVRLTTMNLRTARKRKPPGEWWKSASKRQATKPTPVWSSGECSVSLASNGRSEESSQSEEQSRGTRSHSTIDLVTSEPIADLGSSSLDSPALSEFVSTRTTSNRVTDERAGILESSRSEIDELQSDNTMTCTMRRRRGRGNRSIPLQRLGNGSLKSRADLILSANSKSSKANVRRARKVLLHYCAKHDAPDPSRVTSHSSVLIMNLLADYCNFGKPNSLKNDAMGSLIQGLRIVYEEHGHITAWNVRDGQANGNPLIENRDITKLRRAHRVHLSKLGVLTISARPITAGIICDHAAKFWYNGNDEDILLHSIFVLGINLGLRYDEVSNLEMKFVSISSDSVTLRTSTGVKNQTSQRTYKIEEWPGNSSLQGSVFMDPVVALLSWLTVRGAADGFLFCDVKKTSSGVCKIDPTKSLSSDRFNSIMRSRLLLLGVGPGDTLMYSGHSLKRGAVQLYRSLGLKDEYIMKKVQMVGANAYLRYCEAFNDCAPDDLPRFSGVEGYIQHAARIHQERQMHLDENEYSKYISYVLGENESG